MKLAIDTARVKAAIEAAEKRTSGEIVVSVAPFFIGSVQRAAERAFAKLGLEKTRQRNGILFFLVPSRRAFVVLGDEGIHQKVGQPFWEAVVAAVSRRFRDGDPTGGLVEGIAEVAEQLATHFPACVDDVNELCDLPVLQ